MYKSPSSAASPLAAHFTRSGLLRFALPSIGMMLVTSIYTVTDGIFIGRLAGSSALAASNIVYPAINLLLGLGIMMASGGSALVTKNLGEGRLTTARGRFSFIVLASLLLSALLAVSYRLWQLPLLHLLGASPALLADAQSYLLVQLPFFPAMAAMLLFNAFYIADGHPEQGLRVAIIAGVTNAALDYICMGPLQMGIAGAGLATGMANLGGALYGLLYFSRFSHQLRFKRPEFSLRVLTQTLGNGSSELVTQLSVGITTLLFNIITFRYAGEDGITAISIILYSEMLLTSLFMGFSTGVAPIFSFHFGRRDYGEILRLLRLSLTSIAACALFVFGAAQLLAAPLAGLFLTTEASAYELTRDGFRLFAFSFLLSGLNMFTSSFFTALSDGRTSALISSCRNLFGIVIFLMILPRFLGMPGVWLAVPFSDMTALVLAFWLLYTRQPRPAVATRRLSDDSSAV